MTMNETEAARLDATEANLRSVTDQVGRLMDLVLQKGYVPAFRCGHSGLWLPGDYVKEWGRLYGIGLGPTPVSEVLDSLYDIAPPAITPDLRRIEQVMHPVQVSMAQVDFDMVPAAALKDGKAVAILAADDADMEKRCAIVYQRQLVNPNSRVPLMRSAWLQAGRRA
jgi:hypothetical protein